MDILVTYDVNTLTPEGRARLRRVAKACQGCGQRVQFSVFECSVNETQMELLRHTLLKTINREEDSLRIYNLRGLRAEYIESYGKDAYVNFKGALIV